MTDIFTAEKRSDVMSRIRSKDTRPEMLVRRLLFASGFRFRLHDSRLPGRPDVVMKKWKTVVFVNGCFWHSHPGCRFASRPASHEAYWSEKLRRNRERDEKNQKALLKEGWRVLVVWECACKRAFAFALQARMEHFLRSGQAGLFEIGRNDLDA